MIKNRSAQLLIILIVLFLLPSEMRGQSRISSPYSRFGIGELWHNNYSAVLSGMGNVGYAIQSDNFLNVRNPASYAGFDSTSFLFDISALGSIKTFKTTDISQNGDYASLGYILFGTPITKWWKASFGLIPFSNMGYNVYEDRVLDGIGLTRYVYEGTGGLNQLHLGSGFRITPRLSIGINASYVWGILVRERKITFPDSLYMLSTFVDNADHVSDFLVDIGAQYFMPLKNEMILGFGLVYKPQMLMNVTRAYLAQNYYSNTSGSIELGRDTVAYNPSVKGTMNFPMGIGGGISFEDPNHFIVSADFSWRNWKNFEAFGRSDSLQNSFSINVGGEFIPEYNSISSYWHKVKYRLGFRYESTYLDINNQPIKEFGISFGFGLPFKRSKSMINFAFEIGNKGSLENGLVQENFFKFTLGLSIYERWFVKSKYR